MIKTLKDTELMSYVWAALASLFFLLTILAVLIKPLIAGYLIMASAISFFGFVINFILHLVSRVKTQMKSDFFRKK